MAATRRPIEALESAARYIKRMSIEELRVPVCQDISDIMWMYAPWRWTLGSMTVVPLANNTQDYVISPFPTDFLYLADAFVHDAGTDGNTTPRSLRVVPTLATNVSLIGNPSQISVESTSYRVSPKPATIVGTNNIIGIYKKTAPVLTESSLYTAGVLLFPDEWFWVYKAGVLWMSFVYGDQLQAAGNIQVSGGKTATTGWAGVFFNGLELMLGREKLPIFDQRSVETPPTIR